MRRAYIRCQQGKIFGALQAGQRGLICCLSYLDDRPKIPIGMIRTVEQRLCEEMKGGREERRVDLGGREILLGTIACTRNPQLWRRYSLNFSDRRSFIGLSQARYLAERNPY